MGKKKLDNANKVVENGIQVEQMEITRKAEKKVTQKEDSAIITVVETNEKNNRACKYDRKLRKYY